MKSIIGLTLAALFAASLVPALASQDMAGMPGMAGHKMAAAQAKAKATKVTPAKKKVVSAVCPVRGEKIPDVTKASGKSVYKGKTYYFCCARCKPAFDKNPLKYIKK